MSSEYPRSVLSDFQRVAFPMMLSLSIFGAPLAGMAQTISTPSIVGPALGNQFFPKISGDWIVYTSYQLDAASSEFCYYNIADPLARACLPNTGNVWGRWLSDVSGTTAALGQTLIPTDEGAKSTIALFNLNQLAQDPIEVAPTNAIREFPSIGGQTVAFVEAFAESEEIVLYDIGGSTLRLTHDSDRDLLPQVSPDGSVVVWSKCSDAGGECNAWQAVRTVGGWDDSVIPGSTTYIQHPPATDGVTVVFGTGPSSDLLLTDLCWRPVAGGTTQCLNAPGWQFLPTISGRAIAFLSTTDVTTSFGLYVYDTAAATSTLVRIASGVNVAYPDIDGSGNAFRLTWSEYDKNDTTGYAGEVYWATIALPPSASALLQQLIDTVQLENLKKGIANSLDAKLTNAQSALASAQAGNYGNACAMLSAFINEVQAQSGKSITTLQATAFIALANAVRAAMGCAP